MELFDRLSTVRSHSPDVGKVRILMEDHGKCVGIELGESLAQSCDQGLNRLFGFRQLSRIYRVGESQNSPTGDNGGQSQNDEARHKCVMIRSSRLAEPQFVVALDMADPIACDSIAGTLIEAMAAAKESTTRAFWDLVFCRILTISAISENVTAKALTIAATATKTCRFMRPADA